MPILAPSLDDIERAALEVWTAFPSPFKDLAYDAVFRIEDFADDETLRELGLEDPFELSGLYRGVDLTQRSMTDPIPSAPMVFLYRRAILEEWIERGDIGLAELVAHILVHEIGHHFGFSDEQMDEILERD